MPSTYQGTKFLAGKNPILHLNTPDGISDARQQGKLSFINQINREHLAGRLGDSELEARIASYELAFRMQAHAPEAVDLAEETAANLNADFDGATDMKDVFQKLVKNPTKLMGLVKTVGDKLDSKIKSGDLKESELIAEASEMMNKMKETMK